MLYAGTQSFAQADTTSSALNTILGNPTITTTESRKYELLAFAGSVQFVYAIKTWQINLTPYIIQPYNTGQSGSYFLYTIGVNVTF